MLNLGSSYTATNKATHKGLAKALGFITLLLIVPVHAELGVGADPHMTNLFEVESPKAHVAKVKTQPFTGVLSVVDKLGLIPRLQDCIEEMFLILAILPLAMYFANRAKASKAKATGGSECKETAKAKEVDSDAKQETQAIPAKLPPPVQKGPVRGDVSCGLEPTIISYNTAIDTCAKSGNILAAERYIAKMQEVQLEPNVVTYSTVIHACARAGDVAKAEVWLSQMARAGVDANVISYNSVIHACAKKGEYERAELWLSKMLKAGLQANVTSYSADRKSVV